MDHDTDMGEEHADMDHDTDMGEEHTDMMDHDTDITDHVTDMDHDTDITDHVTDMDHDDVKDHKDDSHDEKHEWNYKQYGAEWGAEYPLCDSGREQSPIDLSWTNFTPSTNQYIALYDNYQNSKASVVINTHTVVTSVTSGMFSKMSDDLE